MITLPETATRKLAELADAEADARLVVHSCIQRINELNNAISLSPESERVPEYEGEISRLSVKQMEQQARYQHSAKLNGRLRDFLRSVSQQSGELEQARAVIPKLQKGETAKQAVDRVRDEIAALQAEYRKVKAAPPPIADLKAAAKAHVAAIAEKGKPRVTADHTGFKFEFSSDGWGPRLNLESILAWLYPEALLEKFYAELDGLPKVGLALSIADKKEKLSALASQIASAEQQEVAIVEMAADQGVVIAHRADVDCRALLGIVVKQRGSVAA